MKTRLIFLVTLLFSVSTFAQQITGDWYGALKVQAAMQLRIVFHISQNGDKYSATLDSPDQGAKGIPVSSTSFANSKLDISMPNLMAEYNGELKGDSITGTFKQRGMSFPLNLTRHAVEKQTIKRPQEPVPPFPYYSEEVTFPNSSAGITLAGTLTLPKKEGKFPVVVLITGSGSQNRDEEIFGHKPFLVIADYLTRNGIGVLRYDDRGFGKSTGNFQKALTTDFASDVESAVAYLKSRKDIDTKKIGLIGHSEGGMIAPMVASKSKDIRFIVMLAGTGLRGDQLIVLQQELIGRATGAPEQELAIWKEAGEKGMDMLNHTTAPEALKQKLTQLLTETYLKLKKDTAQADIKAQISMQVEQMTTPWMRYFLKYDPLPALSKVKCPVLVLNGEKDLQVPAKENVPLIEKALQQGGNKKVTVNIFPNLNHMFQECKTGAPAEYGSIEQTIAPVVLETIEKWIAQTIK
ncbi:alpha/beta fold hydrolase [Paludibacter sp.]|uniref:alpha/beta hydrolase family protein n=1 Tax=Paludibacter sp. TaxID=1898105 RepID=UPI00135461E8|nr:alpha/beta fold hydrolase [Paludibacter sp.]MTK54085.1 alpha/beta fold hydrolase [Paludibacter sp.]